MDKTRLVTYSLLAHINNTGTLTKGLIDIFVPLAKSALAEMNSSEIYSGKNISEIKKVINGIYSIDIPIPVLKNILHQIANEVNTDNEEKFIIYKDGAFSIKNYVFNEFESLIEEKKILIENVERLFQEFCSLNNINKSEYSSIFNFLEINKTTISKYLTEKHATGKKEDYTLEAQFVSFFRQIPQIYNTIKELYLGSILSSYIEYSTKPIELQVELLLDTNFVISLIDLNTPESTDTCRKLIEIARHNGYRISILNDTIDEIQRLLLRRAEHFNESFLTKKVNPEDIYNACDRRGLTKTDLETISDNLPNLLNQEFGIVTIPITTKYSNIAKFSKEYKNLQKFRNNTVAALHDATAIYYVREKRGNKRFKAFEKVNCWFVNNAFNNEYDDFSQCEEVFGNGFQPEIIKADVLLNILWLSNPNVGKDLNSEEIINVGLPALISSALNESLPKNAIIRELDDNIQKYAKDKLSDEQIVRVATRIANKQISKVENLNKLADESKEKFVKRLQVEAEKQKKIEEKRIAQFEKIVVDLRKESGKIKKEKANIEAKETENERLKNELVISKIKELEKENQIREIKRSDLINKELSKWRKKSWIELSISLVIAVIGLFILLIKSNWSLSLATELFISFKSNILISFLLFFAATIFSAIIIRTLFNKYRNMSNIKAFIDLLNIPDDLKELKPSR
ncbi:hypothetical protein [Sunxiuqinia indica]|uniref:hypothetical protein n=1 Tax=Sunxiuqinia indica TaxID=2692584 RepID=UPI001358A5E9|nr:hypothetical protein [Sunxiuqinia indica]